MPNELTNTDELFSDQELCQQDKFLQRIDAFIEGLCTDFDMALDASQRVEAQIRIRDFMVQHAYGLFGLTEHDLYPAVGLPLKVQHVQFGDIENDPEWLIVLRTLQGDQLALKLSNHAEGWGWLPVWDTRWPRGYDLPDEDLRQLVRDWMALGGDAAVKKWEGCILYAPAWTCQEES